MVPQSRWTPGRRDEVPGCGPAHLDHGVALWGQDHTAGAELVLLTQRLSVRSPAIADHTEACLRHQTDVQRAAAGNSPDDSQESWMREPQQRRSPC